MHVLGLDAGGTKTVALLADASGTILAEARGPGANLQIAGEAGVEQILRDVMAAAVEGRDRPPTAICVGMAGVDRESEAQAVAAVVRRVAPSSRVLVVNDALVALVAGARDDPGIA